MKIQIIKILRKNILFLFTLDKLESTEYFTSCQVLFVCYNLNNKRVTIMARKKSEHYVNNKEFLAYIIKYREYLIQILKNKGKQKKIS